MGLICSCNIYRETDQSEVLVQSKTASSDKMTCDLNRNSREYDQVVMTIIKFQAILRGFLIRKKVKAVRRSHMKDHLGNSRMLSYKGLSTCEITETELDDLFQNYPSLEVEVVLRPPFEYENKSVYHGEWNTLTNERCGRGTQRWEDGSVYSGYWKNDKANIRGVLKHANGDTYEGLWKDDKAEGFGTYHHLDGAIYQGDWKDDKQHGIGRETWPDGAKYFGEYKNGNKSGKGKFEWSDGSTYEGEFNDNFIHGTGVYKWSNGREYSGQWKYNQMHGQGCFKWPDGRKYSGAYKYDVKQGFGVFEWPDGRRYKGSWHDGKPHGEGEYFDQKECQWINGVWSEGEKIIQKGVGKDLSHLVM